LKQLQTSARRQPDHRQNAIWSRGFCEPVWPSNGLDTDPAPAYRHSGRDIQARKRAGIDTDELEANFQYQGSIRCAATGCASQRCPVLHQLPAIWCGTTLGGFRLSIPLIARGGWPEHFASCYFKGARLTVAVASGVQRFSRCTARCKGTQQGMRKLSGQTLTAVELRPCRNRVRWFEQNAQCCQRKTQVGLPARLYFTAPWPGVKPTDEQLSTAGQDARHCWRKAGF